MRVHWPSARHSNTAFVRINPRLCEACGTCVDGCPREVLELLPYSFHRHVHVHNPDLCRGCLWCVAACRRGAIAERVPAASVSPR